MLKKDYVFRTGQDRTGQDRTGQDRTGADSALFAWNKTKYIIDV